MQDGNIPLIKKFFHNKWVWVTLILDIIIMIIVIILALGKVEKTAVMSFEIIPVDATITINGMSGYEGNGEAYEFVPGLYEVVISRSGFETKTFNYELKRGHNSSVVTFLADSDFEYYELRDNYGAFLALANMASGENNRTTDNDTSAEAFIARFQRDYNFMTEDLPMVDKTSSKYGASYGTHYQYDTLTVQEGSDLDGCVETLCLCITDTSGEKEEFALSAIRNLGFDPDDFQIIYKKVGYE